MDSHPILYPNPTPAQLALVGSTMDVGALRDAFPKLYDIFVLNTRQIWEHLDDDEKNGAQTPEEYVASSEDTFIIVPLTDTMAEAFTPENYVQPIEGHMALFMEHTGFTNVTLVFIADGLIG